MNNSQTVRIMPTKIRYKLLVSFCLMSIVPLLVSVYVASLFIKFPFTDHPVVLSSISVALLFTLLSSVLGFQITRQVAYPILDITKAVQDIAKGKLDTEKEIKGSEELEDLSKSLKVISQNAHELMQKVERLSLKDKLTGLYNATYIRERLDEEIQRAIHSQCPCSFAYFKIDQFSAYALNYGPAAAEEVLKAFAKIFPEYLSHYDRAARITTDEFAIIFPNRNKKKSIEMVERIRKGVVDFFASNGIEAGAMLTFCVGISENPIDGVSGDVLYAKALDRMRIAKTKGANQIEAFS